MKKSKNSLKKVYESVFDLTKEDRQADINADFQRRILARNPANAKTLKALYAAGNDDASPANDNNIINQTISTEIPGLGTFDLTPVQIGLIGCINQYYYGDKQLALILINVLKTGQSIESEETSQRFQIAAGRIRENDDGVSSNVNNDKLLDTPKNWSFQMNNLYAKKFLNECVKKNILNKDYSINDGYTISQSKYSISRTSGYLFEFFLCHNIAKKFGVSKINNEETKARLLQREDVLFILKILCVIYKIIDFSNINTIVKSNVDKNIKTAETLYDTLNLNKHDIFKNLIDSSIDRDKLYFDFQQGGVPLDIYVRKNNKSGNVIAIFDLKTSSIGTVNTLLSTTFKKSNDQINQIFKDKSEVSEENTYNNFHISSLNILYSYGIKGVSIDNILCTFVDFKLQYKSIKEKMEDEAANGKDRSFRIEKTSKHFVLSDNRKPITEFTEEDITVDDYIAAENDRLVSDAINYLVNKEAKKKQKLKTIRYRDNLKSDIKYKLEALNDEDLIQLVASKYYENKVNKKNIIMKNLIIALIFELFDGRPATPEEKSNENTNVILNCPEVKSNKNTKKKVDNVEDVIIAWLKKKELLKDKKDWKHTTSLNNFINRNVARYYDLDDIKGSHRVVTSTLQAVVSKYEEEPPIVKSKKDWLIKKLKEKIQRNLDTQPETSSIEKKDVTNANSEEIEQTNSTIDASLPAETGDPSLHKQSVYIPGNVISERLSKKKTLKEVYKNLFSTRLY